MSFHSLSITRHICILSIRSESWIILKDVVDQGLVVSVGRKSTQNYPWLWKNTYISYTTEDVTEELDAELELDSEP